MSGKGSGRRPTLISDDEAEDNWNRIFGREITNSEENEVIERIVDKETIDKLHQQD